MKDGLAVIYLLIAMAVGATWPVWLILWALS